MAYCRFGIDSDVYLFASANGGWECCRCALESSSGKAVSLRFYTLNETVSHMEAHREAGHKVPGSVFEELFNE